MTLTGFREAVRSNVPLAVGQIGRVDISLEVGGVAEVVEVSSAVQLLQTEPYGVAGDLLIPRGQIVFIGNVADDAGLRDAYTQATSSAP